MTPPRPKRSDRIPGDRVATVRQPGPPPERLADVLAEVRRVELRSARLLTDVLSGGYRSTFRGLGVEFSEVREYVAGDDPRSVDWNVTARAGRPFVKRFVEERERTMQFVLDLSPTMARGLGAWSPRMAAVRLCAALSLLAIDNHDRVGLVAGGGDVDRFVLPQPGGGHVLRVLHDVLTLPHGKGWDLAALLATATARVRRRTVVFVISDFLQSGYEQALRLCARRHDVIAVRVLARERFDPPRAVLRLAAADGRRVWCDFLDARFRRAWLGREREQRAAHDGLLAKAGIDGLDLEIPHQPDVAALLAPLLRFFHRREVREVRR